MTESRQEQLMRHRRVCWAQRRRLSSWSALAVATHACLCVCMFAPAQYVESTSMSAVLEIGSLSAYVFFCGGEASDYLAQGSKAV